MDIITVVLGRVQMPKEIASAAIQEDVDAIGYHIMCGDPASLIGALFQELRRQGGEHIPVVIGGIVLPWQVDELKQMGVKEVFCQAPPSSP